jgi:hypothetical protein
MTTFHVIKVNANCNILEIGLTYLLAVIIEAILKLTEPRISSNRLLDEIVIKIINKVYISSRTRLSNTLFKCINLFLNIRF